MQRKVLWRILGTALVLAGIVIAPSAASADIGGGCRDNSARSAAACVSRQGDDVYGDFYINWGYAGFCYAHLEIYVNGRMAKDRWYQPSYNGRYGPISRNVDGYPDRSQTAYSGVTFYDCNFQWITSVRSPDLKYIR